MEIPENIAHLRQLENNNKKFELTFHLTVPSDIVGVAIDEDIRASWRITGTVRSLLGHINSKLSKLIHIKREKARVINSQNVDVPVKLSNKEGVISDGKIISELVDKGENIIFEIFGIRYLVEINAPIIVRVELPEVIYANATVHPVKLKTEQCCPEISRYEWYKSKDKKEWSQVSDHYEYLVSEDDVGYYLKFIMIPRNKLREGRPVEKVSKDTVELVGPIPVCPFERRHAYTQEPLVENEFRIVSYNVLSSRYCEVSQFPDSAFTYCPPKFLSIDYRKHLIVKELLGYNADIMCLQEVDYKHYCSYFKEQFTGNGFSSVYHKKGFRISEGLACIFNHRRFKLIKSQQLVLGLEIQRNRLFSHLWKILQRNENAKKTFLYQATSLQVTVLKARECNTVLIVGNTHLVYRPEVTYIRLLQINMITTFINYLRVRELKANNNVSVIICGDFNSAVTSPVVSYIIDGRIDPKHEECLRVSHEGLELYHEMCLESACGFPKYTNYTKTFKDCLDYIFIEKDRLSILRSIPLPSEEELSEYEGLPNEFYPSDHIALVVDVKLT